MTNFTAAQAKESDAKLAELTSAAYKIEDHLARIETSIHHAAGDKKVYHGRSRTGTWAMDLEDALVAARKSVTAEFNPNRATYQRALDEFDAQTVALAEANAAVSAQATEWVENGQWTRFFMVEGGHIHSSTHCHTLRPTTRVGWLPQLSGESEKDAVDAHGTVLCTFCYPSAPVEWTTKAPKKADPTVCAGSGQDVPDANMQRYTKTGTCTVCKEKVSVTSLRNARKHKAK